MRGRGVCVNFSSEPKRTLEIRALMLQLYLDLVQVLINAFKVHSDLAGFISRLAVEIFS